MPIRSLRNNWIALLLAALHTHSALPLYIPLAFRHSVHLSDTPQILGFKDPRCTIHNDTGKIFNSISPDNFDHLKPISISVLSKRTQPWTDTCIDTCVNHGRELSFCVHACREQAKRGDAAPDALLQDACNFMNLKPDISPFGLQAGEWQIKRKISMAASINLFDGNCSTEIKIFHPLYDWADPEAVYVGPCSFAKSDALSYDFGQCVFQSTSGVPSWFDGPSIPDTISKLKEYTDHVDRAMRILSADFTSKISDTSMEDLVTILAHYRKLFTWSGVNHDLCYHHESSSHGLTKRDCDTKFGEDNRHMCDLTGDAGRTLILQSDGIVPVRIVLPKTCYEWADLCHDIVAFGWKPLSGDLGVDISLSENAWRAANVYTAYNRLDVAQVYAAQHPFVPPPTVQGVYAVDRVITTIRIRGDDKDPDTIGGIRFALTNARKTETLAILPIPAVHWEDQHDYTFETNTLMLFTHDELYTIVVQPMIDCVTQGHDLGRFDLSITIHFVDDKTGPITYCYADVRVGSCGAMCGFFHVQRTIASGVVRHFQLEYRRRVGVLD
jgi:hypothetical protein